jgi:hypothetical protein
MRQYVKDRYRHYKLKQGMIWRKNIIFMKIFTHTVAMQLTYVQEIYKSGPHVRHHAIK